MVRARIISRAYVVASQLGVAAAASPHHGTGLPSTLYPKCRELALKSDCSIPGSLGGVHRVPLHLAGVMPRDNRTTEPRR